MRVGPLRKAALAMVVFAAGIALAADLTGEILAKFSQLEDQYAIPKGILAKFAKVESNGNAGAVNPSTQATGLFQWIPKYWYEFTRQIYGHELTIQDAKNPGIAGNVTAARIKQAQNRLGPLIMQTIGQDNMITGLYLEHFLGEAGARKFLALYKQNPGAPAGSAFPKAAAQNPKWFGGNPTFAQVINKMAAEFKGPGVTQITGYSGPVSTAAEPNWEERRLRDAPAPEPQVDYPTDYRAIFKAEEQKWQNQNPGPQQQYPPQPYQQPQGQQAQCPPRYYCNERTVMQQDASCNTRVVEVCQWGCEGSVCVRNPNQQYPQQQQPYPAFQQPSGQPSIGSSGLGGIGSLGSPAGQPSSFDSISNLLNPQDTRLKQADNTPLAYNQIVSISGSAPKAAAAPGGDGGSEGGQEHPAAQGQGTGAPDTVRLTPPPASGGSGTFTSRDLRDDPNAPQQGEPASAVAAVLAKIKDVLLRIFAFITPR